METYPHISVVIPTCNRPEDVKRALKSLASIEYPTWDLLVVDQSDDSRTREIVESAISSIANLRYLALQEKGCSHGRNVGIKETKGEIVGFLDDDCTVEFDWLLQAARALERHPQAALLLGELRRYDGLGEWAEDGWIPIRHFEEEFEASVLGNPRRRLGIWSELMGNGACMFARRSVVQQVGLFDVQMGGGGRFPAAEDGDYIYRALMAGCTVACTPAVVADHYGLRDYASGAATRLVRSYEYAIGAWFMKVLRLGDPYALFWILVEYRNTLATVHLRNLLSRRGSSGLLPTAMLTRGLIDSFTFRVDRKQKLYAPRAAR